MRDFYGALWLFPIVGISTEHCHCERKRGEREGERRAEKKGSRIKFGVGKRERERARDWEKNSLVSKRPTREQHRVADNYFSTTPRKIFVPGTKFILFRIVLPSPGGWKMFLNIFLLLVSTLQFLLICCYF